MIKINRKERINEIERAIVKVNQLILKLEKKNSNLGWIRFFILVTGTLSFLLSFFSSLKTLALLEIILFSILFIIASIIHNRIIALTIKYNKWVEIKKANLARINLDWNGIPVHKDFASNKISNIELDLDITGENSLHQLIDTAKSREGSVLLRNLLIETPENREEVLYRQSIVKELLGLSHFRNKLLLISSLSSKKEFDSAFMIEWLSKPTTYSSALMNFIVLSFLTFINLVFIGLAYFGVVSNVFLFTSLIYFFVYFSRQKSVKSVALEAETISDQLKKIIGILSFIGNYNFGSKKILHDLCIPLTNKENGPDKKLTQINRVVTIYTQYSNPVIWFVIMLVFPIDFYLALRVEVLKKEISQNLTKWLDAWHKLEAFVSISNYAYLNPEFTFPNIVDAQGEKSKLLFEAEDIGHPLIPHDVNVKNSITIQSSGSIALLTGSNMAGKSTFLRTIATNICLANIGSPVNAKFCSISLARLFTCINVSDSVTDGISYFYAEVQRLKKLLDEIEKENELPMFFFIDEIFKGTNNIERHVGSRAVLKALLNKNGSGIISTHDLELVNLSNEFPSIVNYHFRENVINDQMIFDYKLREGPCPTTNALIIMKAAGLPVE